MWHDLPRYTETVSPSHEPFPGDDRTAQDVHGAGITTTMTLTTIVVEIEGLNPYPTSNKQSQDLLNKLAGMEVQEVLLHEPALVMWDSYPSVGDMFRTAYTADEVRSHERGIALCDCAFFFHVDPFPRSDIVQACRQNSPQSTRPEVVLP